MHRLDRQDRRLIWRGAVVVAGLMAAVAGAPVARWLDGARMTERLDALGARIAQEVSAETSSACTAFEGMATASVGAAPASSPALASWQTVGGCGAGASTGTGGGVKWIGRHVKGGLLNLECQASYVDTPYGYNFIGNTMMSGALTDRWSLAVSVPYLYKYMNDPYAVGIDLANKGPGDISASVTHAFGDTRNWLVSAVAGIPTGNFNREFRTQMLPQDRQLGLGMPSAQLVVDHVADELWGVAVLGTSLSWRGAENEFGSSRAPAASVYGHVAYLVGAFAPSVGLTLTGFAGYDKDTLQEQAMPMAVVSPSMSLEWSADSIAVLASVTTPYEYNVRNSMVRNGNRMGNWMFTLGTAFILY
jgi:hypothetical protein